MNRTVFLTDLRKLLTYMTEEERENTIRYYEGLFEEAGPEREEELLRSFDFERLDPEKNWYDVFISHEAVRLGFRNLLMLGNPVVHKPHSSRPWKQLKYSNPIKYYLMKLLHGRDKI